MARLSFTGFRFELTGIAQSLTTGFNWDNKCKVAWTGSNRIAEKFKQYADGSATQRLQEESARRQRDIQEWPIRHKEWLGRFLEITDRKVSVLDDYGDENWDALRQEIERLLSKTAKVDKDNIEPIERMVFKGLAAEEIAREMDGLDIMRQIELRNKGISVDVLDTLIRKYTFLRSDLETRFRAYHANQEDKRLDEDLDLLTGVDFERYLVNLLKEHGFDDVHTTIATGDQGADLIARLNGRTIVIQAKRYRGSVGNRAVQEVVGAVRYYRADEAWVITSGNFTASAKALAQANDVKLIDGYALRNRQFPLNS